MTRNPLHLILCMLLGHEWRHRGGVATDRKLVRFGKFFMCTRCGWMVIKVDGRRRVKAWVWEGGWLPNLRWVDL